MALLEMFPTGKRLRQAVQVAMCSAGCIHVQEVGVHARSYNAHLSYDTARLFKGAAPSGDFITP